MISMQPACLNTLSITDDNICSPTYLLSLCLHPGISLLLEAETTVDCNPRCYFQPVFRRKEEEELEKSSIQPR